MTQAIKLKEAIAIYNNIAKRKNIRLIPLGAQMTFDQIADRIKKVQKNPPKRRLLARIAGAALALLTMSGAADAQRSYRYQYQYRYHGCDCWHSYRYYRNSYYLSVPADRVLISTSRCNGIACY
jgi:hypothetical protein